MLNAAIQLAMAGLVYFLVPETQTATAMDSAPIGGSIRDVFRDRFFMIFVSLNFGLWAIIEACKLPRLVAKRRRTKVLVLSALLVAVGMGSVAIAVTVPLLMLTVVVWTAGEKLTAPVNGAHIADLSQPEMRGRYQGVAQMTFTLANFVAPVAGGMLLDHARPATLWLVLAGAGVLVAIGRWVTGPARERRALVLTKPHDSQGVPVASLSS